MLPRISLTGALLLSLGGVVFSTSQTTSVPRTSETQLATVTQYCAGCHNDRTKAAGVSFDGLTPAAFVRSL